MSETGMHFDRGKADWIGAGTGTGPAAKGDLDLGLWLTAGPRDRAGLSAGRADLVDAELRPRRAFDDRGAAGD